MLHAKGQGDVLATSAGRYSGLGRWVITAGIAVLIGCALLQGLHVFTDLTFGFASWRPVLYAFAFCGVTLAVGRILIDREAGYRALFVLPAVWFTIAMVVFPTGFGLYIALTDWNLSAVGGPHFNGLDNLVALFHDAYFWNALGNMVLYCLAVIMQYTIAFGIALLLNGRVIGRKFFRVIFLLPFMLSPVAVSWMIGKSIMEYRFGPLATLARYLGWSNPAFYATPWSARLSLMAMNAWVSIPFVMILLLAGLQALPSEVMEAADVDGANAWQRFWKVVFPLTLPVSITAIILRVIFELKLADLVINVTAGGPGGATDTVSSFVFREYRDRSNVGYGTMLAEFYFLIVIVVVTVLLALAGRLMRRIT